MRDATWHTLVDAVAALATDGVVIQRLLDAASSRQRDTFLRALKTAPAHVQSLLLPLAPASQTLHSHTVRCEVRMSVDHTANGGVLLSPLNLGFWGLYETSEQEKCSITVEVTTAPHPNWPSAVKK